MCLAVIHVFESVGKADCEHSGEAGESVGERMRARPSHLLEQMHQPPRVTSADQPETAVFGWAEYQVLGAQQAKSDGDVASTKRRNIRADQYHWAGRAGAQSAEHPDAEIAPTLANGFDLALSLADAVASLVRGHSDPQMPAPVRAEA